LDERFARLQERDGRQSHLSETHQCALKLTLQITLGIIGILLERVRGLQLSERLMS
jgi:hypothetical protein